MTENTNKDNLLDSLSALAEQLGCAVKPSEPLSAHTTFRVGGSCDVMIIPNSVESLSELIRFTHTNGIRTLIMGNGSNMLCDDEGFGGAVILLDKSLGGIEILGDNTIRAYAGVQLINVCNAALEAGLSGLEFAYGIPGTVGGGVFMNAGAYGGEMKDVLASVTAVDMNGELHTYTAEQLDLGYRHSRFSDSGEVIVSAVFKLEKGEKDAINAKMNDLMSRRRDKQPLNFPSAGSTFKRPEGQFAGKLIQDCGLRGYSIGGAQVSEKHCGFIINKGGATAADIRALIKFVQDTVLEKTGFMLECEVRIIPCGE